MPPPRHFWRRADRADASSIGALSRALLGPLGEADAIFEERMELCPEGVLVLTDGSAVGGYFVSHPWRRAEPPVLHRSLGGLPSDPDCWFIHDVAVAPAFRGAGAVAAALETIAAAARRRGLPRMALVAVEGAEGFWSRLGFRVVENLASAAKLTAYGAGAAYMERPV